MSELWETYQRIQTKILKEIDPKDSVEPKVDRALQRYMWPWVRKLRDIEFYEDTTAAHANQTENDQPESARSEELSAQPMDTDPAEPPAPENDPMDVESSKPVIPDPEAEAEPEPEPATEASSPPQPQKAKATKAKAKAKAKAKPKPKPKKTRPPPKKAKRPKKVDDDDDFEPDAEDSEEDEESDFDPDASDEDQIVTDEDDAEDASTARKPPKESNTTKQRRQHEEEKRSQRKHNFVLIPDILSLSYDEVEEKYNDRLFAVASEKLVNEQVMVAVPVSFKRSSAPASYSLTAYVAQYQYLSQLVDCVEAYSLLQTKWCHPSQDHQGAGHRSTLDRSLRQVIGAKRRHVSAPYPFPHLLTRFATQYATTDFARGYAYQSVYPYPVCETGKEQGAKRQRGYPRVQPKCKWRTRQLQNPS